MRRAPQRIMIVDDHPLFVDALKLALRPIAPQAAISAAPTLADAKMQIGSGAPDLILLDLDLPDAGGAEGVAAIMDVAGRALLVVVSGRDDPMTVGLVRALGCDGFISKASPLTSIQEQLQVVLAGEKVFGTAEEATGLASSVAALTPAQAKVLAAAATGKLNKQIAHEMNLAEPTVKSHMSAIFKRLGVNNRTQAILAINGGDPSRLPGGG